MTGVIGWLDQPVLARAPATSANIGPGFDALGLALTVYDVVQAEVTGDDVRVEVVGSGTTGSALRADNLAIRAMRMAFDLLGEQPPGLAVRCQYSVPQGFGLGSSAAAIVAGLLAARALAGNLGADRLPAATLLRLAADLEGHADNVAASLFGGLTIAWTAGGSVRSTRLEPLPGLVPVLCLPAKSLSTKTARLLLPATVPHADAAMTASRAALMVTALTSDPALLLDATEDFLHQPYRTPAMPASAGLIAALRGAEVPAVVSGAGPAVLAIVAPGVTPGPDIVASIAQATGEEWDVRVLDIDRAGGVAEAVRSGGATLGVAGSA
jgi:homoserine kinase